MHISIAKNSIYLPRFVKIRYQEWKYCEQSRELKLSIKIIYKVLFIEDKAK